MDSYPIPEHSYHPKKEPRTDFQFIPVIPLLLAPNGLAVALPSLDIPYKWNHIYAAFRQTAST